MFYSTKINYGQRMCEAVKFNIGNNNCYSLYYDMEIERFGININDYIFLKKTQSININENILLNDEKRCINMNKTVLAYNDDRRKIILTLPCNLTFNEYNIYLNDYDLFGYTQESKIDIMKSLFTYGKITRNIDEYSHIALVCDKPYVHYLEKAENNLLTKTYSNKLFLKDNILNCYKDTNKIVLNKIYNIPITEHGKAITINQSLNINDFSKKLHLTNSILYLKHYNAGIYECNNYMIEQKNKKMNCLTNSDFGKVDITDISILDSFISARDKIKELGIEYGDIFFNISSKWAEIECDGIWTSVLPKSGGINDKFAFIDKNSNNIFIDDKVSNIKCSYKNLNIEYKQDGIYKSYKPTYLNDNNMGGNKSAIESEISDSVVLKSAGKVIEIDHKDVQLKKSPFETHFFKYDINLKKESYKFNNLTNDINLKKESYKSDNLTNDITVSPKARNVYAIDNLSTKIKESKSGINNNILIKRDFYHINNGKYSDMIYQKYKDVYIPNNLNMEMNMKKAMIPYEWTFVDVIKFPDFEEPTLEDGDIDELILPHKDYKYRDFLKNLLFDSGNINWDYVKSYNAKTGEYIISIPIENPINIYADIARDYIDLDVNVLYNSIYHIKEIWKDRMFKYATMSAQDSLKDIMIRLDKYLEETYKNDSKKRYQSRRCLQLFRWYSEMAILNNCDYILKFDTKKSAVDYYNKNLGELKNMIVLDEMHINDEYIIAPVDDNKSCAITFINTNYMKDPPLKLHLKLYNINTEVTVSVIDDTDIKKTKYEQGIYNLDFDLKDRVNIRYVPTGKNQSMNIADISIDGITTRGFSVSYQGAFGEINSVMRELLDNLLIAEDISEEIKNKLGGVTPTTIAIDTMIKYYEFHHRNKSKGKRLITKK